MNSTTTPTGSVVECTFTNFILFDFNIESVTSREVFVSHLIFCVINAVLSVLTICLNSISAMAYWNSTELKRKTAHFLIMILSLNDLVVGIICGPLYVAVLAREYSLRKFSCFIRGIQLFLLLLICGCSLMTLVLMNFERYFAIVHPIFHRTKVTKGLLVKCLIVLWLVNVGIISLIFYSQDVLTKCLSVESLLFMSALVFIYVRIYFASRKSFHTFRRMNITNASPQGQDTSQLEREQHLRNLRLVKSCCIVVVCFWMCFLPACVLVTVISNYNELTYMFHTCAETSLLLNSSLNSLIFFWKNKLLRKEAQRVLKRLLCKTNIPPANPEM